MILKINELQIGDEVFRVVPPSPLFAASVHKGTVEKVGMDTLTVRFKDFGDKFQRITGRAADGTSQAFLITTKDT